MLFTICHVINDNIIHGGFRTHVSNVFAIRRPIVRSHRTDTRLLHDLTLAAFHVGDIQGIPFLAPHDFLGVGRPFVVKDIAFQSFN